jgi:hypothetical protein
MMVKILGVVIFITTISYLILIIATDYTREPSTTSASTSSAFVSLGAAWTNISIAWTYLNAPLKIYRDKIEYLDRVIPLSRIERITRVEEDGRIKFWIKAKGWWPKMFLPWYFKCDPGSPKCAAFDALMKGFEGANERAPSVS